MARKPRRLDHLDDREPSFKQIAQLLKSKLDMKGIDPGPDRNAEDVEDGDRNGGIITLSYGEFYEMAGCKQLRKRLYTEVELEASRIGIVVAFGWNAIIVATDNFAPESWSTFAHEPRPVHPVEHAPKRPKPKLTEAQKQSLFNRIGKKQEGIAMKRLVLACLLAVSSHGWASDLDPECYELYDQFLAADWVNAGRIAGRMHDLQCWPALQNTEGSSTSSQVMQPATDCGSLVPHVVKMVNDQAHVNGYSIVQTADAKVMTYETIDRVADGHDIFITITDNQGRSARGRQGLKHDDTAYVRGKGYYTSPKYAYNDEGYYVPISPTYTYGNDGTVLVPNSKPFAASPLMGSTRALDCSAEAQFTQGPYLIQMYLDRNAGGQEFIGMSVLMEL